MGEITIPPGETEQIVSQPEPNDEYNAGVTGSDVYLSHRPSGIRREGKRVRPGDRVTLRNLRGKPIYAKNPPSAGQAATVEINRAAFALIFQPRAVQASVQTGDSSESAPRTDAFVTRTGDGVDVSSSSTSETFRAPDRADFVQLFVETGGSSVRRHKVRRGTGWPVYRPLV